MPWDFFETITDPAPSLFRWIWQYIRLIFRVPSFIFWLRRHREAQTFPLLNQFCDGLRDPSFGIHKLAAQGYCWGGRFAITFPRFDAFISIHPAEVQVPADLKRIQVPGCFILAKGDSLFTARMVEQTRALLRDEKPGLRVEVREYDGVHHGFANRGRDDDPKVIAAREVSQRAGLHALHSPASRGGVSFPVGIRAV